MREEDERDTINGWDEDAEAINRLTNVVNHWQVNHFLIRQEELPRFVDDLRRVLRLARGE